MKYQQPTFTLPTTTRRMTQTDYEIAVGLRTKDGKLIQPKKSRAGICVSKRVFLVEYDTLPK